MKLILLILTSILSLSILAETVKLKITYNGNGINGHTVYVMLGGSSLGSGVTNSSGEVSINVSSLPSKNIDLKGEKKCEGAQKSWEVKGFVTLDNNNYAHLKMEEPISEMVEASGGFMSESMMVNSYGLVCAGSNSSPSTSGNGSSSTSTNESSNSETSTTSSSNSSNTTSPMTKEEMLANQKAGYEAKVSNLDRKIEKKQAKIDKGDLDSEKQYDFEYDIKEMQVEKKIAQNNLDRVNTEINNGTLTKAERNRFKEANKELKEELKAIKQERKDGIGTTTPPESANEEKSVVTEADLADMSTMQLKRKKLDYKSKLTKLKTKLKTRKKFMSPNEISEVETEITTLEAAVELLNNEITTRSEKDEE